MHSLRISSLFLDTLIFNVHDSVVVCLMIMPGDTVPDYGLFIVGPPTVDPCYLYPCLNDGTCLYNKTLGTYVCLCDTTFTGPKCEYELLGRISICIISLIILI